MSIQAGLVCYRRYLYAAVSLDRKEIELVERHSLFTALLFDYDTDMSFFFKSSNKISILDL